MSDTLRRIADLVQGAEVQISAHGYDEMAEDGILGVFHGIGVTIAVPVVGFIVMARILTEQSIHEVGRENGTRRSLDYLRMAATGTNDGPSPAL